jgi:succinoglycan biosynthesis transport protein ExoP
MAERRQLDIEESTPGNPAFSILSIARTVWKRKFVIVSIWVLASMVAVAVVRRLLSVYVAESTVLVDSQKIPEKFVSATVGSDLQDRIAAIRQQIMSSGELDRIIRDYNLYEKQRKTHFQEEILEMMRNDITIDLMAVQPGRDQRTAAFKIGYQGPDPTVVAKVANRLTDLYVEQNLKTREGQAEGTSEFLDSQLKEAKQRLDQLEAAVSAYKLKHNGELPEQENSLAGAITGLNSRLEANRDAINRAQQTKDLQSAGLAAMEAALSGELRALEAARSAGVPAAAALDPRGNAIPARKTSEVLQDRLNLLLTQYTENYPEVREVRHAIEVAKRSEAEQRSREQASAARNATPAAGNGSPAPIQAPEPAEVIRTREQIAGLKAQIKAAQDEIASRTAEQQRILHEMDLYQGRIQQLPIREQEMAQLTRDYAMSKDNYKSLLDKQMAAAMALDMERRQQSERFTVLDRAKVPEKPIKPKRPMLYGAGMGGSLALGLLIGFLLELRRNVFLGEWELPKDATILARLPYIEIPVGTSGVRRAKSRATASVGSSHV